MIMILWDVISKLIKVGENALNIKKMMI